MNKAKERIKVKGSFGDQIMQVIIYLGMGLFGVVTILPFLYVLAGSFATQKELVERTFFIIPREISFNAFKFIAETCDVLRGLKN